MSLSRKEKIWLSIPIGVLGIMIVPMFIAATLNSIKHTDPASKRAAFSPLVELTLDAHVGRTEDGILKCAEPHLKIAHRVLEKTRSRLKPSRA